MCSAPRCQTEHGRPASAGFAVILTAKSKAVGTTASRHSQDGCVPIHDSEVALLPSSLILLGFSFGLRMPTAPKKRGWETT